MRFALGAHYRASRFVPGETVKSTRSHQIHPPIRLLMPESDSRGLGISLVSARLRLPAFVRIYHSPRWVRRRSRLSGIHAVSYERGLELRAISSHRDRRRYSSHHTKRGPLPLSSRPAALMLSFRPRGRTAERFRCPVNYICFTNSELQNSLFPYVSRKVILLRNT